MVMTPRVTSFSLALSFEMEASRATRPHQLHSREKELIYNVNKFFMEERAYGAPLIPPSKPAARTARATNVCERTVRRICSGINQARMTQESPEPPVFSSPKKRRSATVTNLDDFDKRVVRRTVLEFYERKEIPTLNKIQEELKQSISFEGGVESLRKILMDIGFKYRKVDGRKFLMERLDVVATRTQFLRQMHQVRESSNSIVYLDETWVNQNYTVEKCWTDTTSDAATGIKPPTGKGSRLIVLHAGTKDGFINNCELIFRAVNDGDYHKQMNGTMFEEWFKDKLLPNIEPHSAIVMDNAPYHSALLEKNPTSSWRKADLRDWLERKGVQPSPDLLRAELYALTKKIAVGKKYRIDSIAEAAGHKVVRLPPYHCHYNPIELIWAQVKTHVAKNNNYKMASLQPLVKEALSLVTASNWMKAVQHAEGLQEEDARQDVAVDHLVESFIINVEEESSEEELSD